VDDEAGYEVMKAQLNDLAAGSRSLVPTGPERRPGQEQGPHDASAIPTAL